jgi:5'(3')-deoxyribonucleotidase
MERKVTNKMKNIRIYVDLDGVLVDWLGGACKTCKINEYNPVIRKKLKEGVSLESIIGEENMWSLIKEKGIDWWVGLKTLPWTYMLYDALCDFGYEVTMLSSPGNLYKYPETFGSACAGKALWVKNHFSDAKLVLTRDKEVCATPHPVSILIDDSVKKVEKFKEYGGLAFLWPNKYKIMDGEERAKELIEKIAGIIKNTEKAYEMVGKCVLVETQ